MAHEEEGRRRDGRPPLKYHGKWPFARLLGVQEPASVLASLANLASHAYGYARLRRAWSKRVYPMRLLWSCYAALSVNAWLWSAVFHCRDTHLTERLDYIAADVLLAFALFAACVRALHLFSTAQWLPLAVALGGCLAYHCWYMLAIKFDYGLNVAVRRFSARCTCLLTARSAWRCSWRCTVSRSDRVDAGVSAPSPVGTAQAYRCCARRLAPRVARFRTPV
jgi:hypothetical protein